MNLNFYSFGNEKQILKSDKCGCYYCCEMFEAKEVVDWITEKDYSRTARCPYCGIDSVIGDFLMKDINETMLEEFNEEAFQHYIDSKTGERKKL